MDGRADGTGATRVLRRRVRQAGDASTGYPLVGRVAKVGRDRGGPLLHIGQTVVRSTRDGAVDAGGVYAGTPLMQGQGGYEEWTPACYTRSRKERDYVPTGSNIGRGGRFPSDGREWLKGAVCRVEGVAKRADGG